MSCDDKKKYKDCDGHNKHHDDCKDYEHNDDYCDEEYDYEHYNYMYNTPWHMPCYMPYQRPFYSPRRRPMTMYHYHFIIQPLIHQIQPQLPTYPYPIPYPTPMPRCYWYTVQPGDSMYRIAQRYNIPLNRLIAANPQIPDPNLIYPGQRICIPQIMGMEIPEVMQPILPIDEYTPPMKPVTPPTAVEPIMDAPLTMPQQDCRWYTVRRGDTMYSIAQRYNIPLDQLIAANPQIPNPDLIYPGQRICIPGMGMNGCEWYTVQRGDTMYTIAQQHNIPLNQLITANPQIQNPNLIYPGQRICIPRR